MTTGPETKAIERNSRQAASFKVICRGQSCRRFVRIVAEPYEADARVIEFMRQHAECYRIDIDENGLEVTGFGVTYGKGKSEAED